MKNKKKKSKSSYDVFGMDILTFFIVLFGILVIFSIIGWVFYHKVIHNDNIGVDLIGLSLFISHAHNDNKQKNKK